MIRWASLYFASISPAFIDGCLYVLIAFFGALMASCSSDDAAKYIAPEPLFYIKGALGSVSAALLALKMFRSTSFADHQQSKQNPVPSYTPEPNKETPTP